MPSFRASFGCICPTAAVQVEPEAKWLSLLGFAVKADEGLRNLATALTLGALGALLAFAFALVPFGTLSGTAVNFEPLGVIAFAAGAWCSLRDR